MATHSVKLRAFESKDCEALHRWTNDPESIRLVGRVPRSLDETVASVERKRRNGDLLMAVEAASDLVGWVFLQNIEYEHGRASIGILLDPHYHGQGYGRMAMRLMLEIGFNQLRLHKIYLTTRGFNERAIKLYKSLGFIEEGRLREHAFVDGAYSDSLLMGILSNEWKNSAPSRYDLTPSST